MQEKWAHFSPVQFLPAFSVAPWDREQPSDLQREKGQTISSQTIMHILHSLSLKSYSPLRITSIDINWMIS